MLIDLCGRGRGRGCGRDRGRDRDRGRYLRKTSFLLGFLHSISHNLRANNLGHQPERLLQSVRHGRFPLRIHRFPSNTHAPQRILELSSREAFYPLDVGKERGSSSKVIQNKIARSVCTVEKHSGWPLCRREGIYRIALPLSRCSDFSGLEACSGLASRCGAAYFILCFSGFFRHKLTFFFLSTEFPPLPP